ncbi:type II secretion system F family protein [Microbacterium sp. SLBN-146]|uniref:type II secretion system F family protein n=1 Tax=Microbacterium sp. SLBN-146 TaxID=2768457 RepID=UPI0021B3B97B|nr:type II secretion system F family protein [Microbacterium sp. SLBN-146]
MTDLAYAVVFGSAIGIGISLMLSLARRWGAPPLTRRVAPYIRDVTDPRGLTLEFETGHDLRSLWTRAQARFAQIAGGEASLERRLRQAGWTMDAAALRGRQLAWSIVGVGGGGLFLITIVLVGRGSAVVWLVPPLCGAAGMLIVDMLLTRAARARVVRIEEELPTVLEFLALCLSAGEGILDSLRRVGEVGVGDLTRELQGVVLAVGTGSSLSETLARLSRDLDIPAVSRSTDQIVAAIERGAPLAHVLQAQALDAREEAKRALLESAGRKEILMLLPLVFLILPLSVLFAVFPGIFMLRLGIG